MGNVRMNVNWKKYLSSSNDEFIEYVSKYRIGFLETIVNNVIDAHRNKQPSLILFRFSKTNITSVAHHSDYEVILVRLLQICEKVELYEMCSKIMNYFRRLQRTSKSTYISDKVTIHNGKSKQKTTEGKSQV